MSLKALDLDEDVRRNRLESELMRRRERKPNQEREQTPPMMTKLPSTTHRACTVKFHTTSHVSPGGSVASAADAHVPSVHALEKRILLFVEYACKKMFAILRIYSTNTSILCHCAHTQTLLFAHWGVTGRIRRGHYGVVYTLH